MPELQVQPGRCRDRVQVLKATDSANSFGETGPVFSVVATRWACVEDQGGRELFFARQIDPQVTCLVLMRYFAGLTTRHKLQLPNGRVLNIVNIGMGDRRKHWMQLSCIEELKAV